jgi:hypothetical protein
MIRARHEHGLLRHGNCHGLRVRIRLLLSTLLLISFTHGNLFVPGQERLEAGRLETERLAILERFLATDDSSPTEFRARRHLEARTAHFDAAAWMDVNTEGTPSDFRYTILAESGSDYIRSHVFKSALETERKMWLSDAADRGAITPKNYTFDDRGAEPAGLAQVGVKPKRKDLLLLDGSIFLRPDDGDLVTVKGTLSKNPSLWVRHIEVVGHYERIAGVRLPVAFESVANVVIAGESRFTMTYDYQMVNGQQISHKN